MDVMAGNSPEGELRSEPFPKGGRQGHLGPIEFGLAASEDVQIHLGDKGSQFDDLGVVEEGDRETIDITETQAHMAISFGSRKGVTKGGIRWEQRRGKNNSWVVVVVIVVM